MTLPPKADRVVLQDIAATAIEACRIAARNGFTFEQAISYFQKYVRLTEGTTNRIDAPGDFAVRWFAPRTVSVIKNFCPVALSGQIFGAVPPEWPPLDKIWSQRKRFPDERWEAAMNFFGFLRIKEDDDIYFRSIYDPSAPEELFVLDLPAWMLGRYVVRQPFHSKIWFIE